MITAVSRSLTLMRRLRSPLPAPAAAGLPAALAILNFHVSAPLPEDAPLIWRRVCSTTGGTSDSDRGVSRGAPSRRRRRRHARNRSRAAHGHPERTAARYVRTAAGHDAATRRL